MRTSKPLSPNFTNWDDNVSFGIEGETPVVRPVTDAPSLPIAPAWMKHAACAEVAVDDADFMERKWAGRRGEHRAAVVAQTCSRCAVRAECLDYAAAHATRHGVWGGVNFADPDALAHIEQSRIDAGSVVYFAQVGRLIKIGTSMELARRMEAIGGRLLACEPGSYVREAQLHRKFADERHGNTERFDASPRLLAYIEAVAR